MLRPFIRKGSPTYNDVFSSTHSSRNNKAQAIMIQGLYSGYYDRICHAMACQGLEAVASLNPGKLRFYELHLLKRHPFYLE